jgi:hypothetical protein
MLKIIAGIRDGLHARTVSYMLETAIGGSWHWTYEGTKGYVFCFVPESASSTFQARVYQGLDAYMHGNCVLTDVETRV